MPVHHSTINALLAADCVLRHLRALISTAEYLCPAGIFGRICGRALPVRDINFPTRPNTFELMQPLAMSFVHNEERWVVWIKHLRAGCGALLNETGPRESLTPSLEWTRRGMRRASTKGT